MIEDDVNLVNVPLDKLPHQIREGDHIRITIEDREVSKVEIDDEGKGNAEARIQAKLDRLLRGDHLQD